MTYKSKSVLEKLLVSCTVRDIAKMFNVSPASIRYWIRKFRLPSRTVSDAMKLKLDYISNCSKAYWQQEEHKKRHSDKMRQVQKDRKPQLSEAAKKNWANNRDKIINGIRLATTEQKKQKLSVSASKSWTTDRKKQQSYTSSGLWSDTQYRQKLMGNTQAFIDKAISLHGSKFNYDYTEYTHSNDKVCITCNDCGQSFWRLPHGHLRASKCPYCNISTQQHEIGDAISGSIGESVVYNDRTTLYPFEIDILCNGIGIEYHGLYWHSFDRPETTAERNRHQIKWAYAQKHNIQLLQIFEHEWKYKKDIVLSIIKHRLKKSIKINARDLTVCIDINPFEFYATYHLQGARHATHHVCLIDADQNILMAGSFSHSSNGSYELIRMASAENYCVRGGVAKIFANFIRIVKPKQIFTFADLRYSNANGYLSVGFKIDKITNPGYFYYHNSTKQLLSRQKCQKHKLHKLLPVFDPNLTEPQNMFNNGYRRVWDAGHLRLTLTL